MKVQELYDYSDPENKDEIIEKIRYCKTLKDIETLIIETFPNWIIKFSNKYSNDYPHLQSNWENISKEFKIKNCQIIIVDKVIKENDEKHTLLIIFAELFTRSGFIVRDKDELIVCEVCNAAIPCEETYNMMKEKGIELPINEWNPYCSECKKFLN